jgi:hypothetical protein
MMKKMLIAAVALTTYASAFAANLQSDLHVDNQTSTFVYAIPQSYNNCMGIVVAGPHSAITLSKSTVDLACMWNYPCKANVFENSANQCSTSAPVVGTATISANGTVTTDQPAIIQSPQPFYVTVVG